MHIVASPLASPKLAPPDDSNNLSPFMLGALDAQDSRDCVPEYYYIRRGQQCEYCEGYADVAGPTEVTRYFLGEPKSI